MLGWLAQSDDPFTTGLLEVDPAAAIEKILPDATLADLIRSAAGDRVHPEILTPGGLYAVRHLTAYVRAKVALEQGEEIAAHSALMLAIMPICAIRDRGGWLNSLQVVGLRLAGTAHNGRSSPATDYLAELRDADHAKILAPRLFGRGKGGLTHLLNQFGAEQTIGTIKAVLTRAMFDGKAVGSVTTWRYFEAAIVDELHLRTLEKQGIRPGDVFGAHKRKENDDGF